MATRRRTKTPPPRRTVLIPPREHCWVESDAYDRSAFAALAADSSSLQTLLDVGGTLVPNTELGHLQVRGRDAEKRAAESAREREELSWKQWAKRLNEYFTALEALLWPDLIVVGGGVSKKSEKFLPRLETRAEVVPAMLLNEAGIVGAALAARTAP